MARIFVSHSAVGDALAEKTRDRLFEHLGDGHEVFVDARVLNVGDVWPSVIYDSLATSQVGVVILNAAAVKSRWVHREVDILLWRRALGADVLLVPVLLGDVAEPSLRWAGMSELLEWQHVRVRDE